MKGGQAERTPEKQTRAVFPKLRLQDPHPEGAWQSPMVKRGQKYQRLLEISVCKEQRTGSMIRWIGLSGFHDLGTLGKVISFCEASVSSSTKWEQLLPCACITS